MSQDDLSNVSRVLSKILRHEPDLVGARLDQQGWIDVDELVRCIERARGAPGAPKRMRSLPEVDRYLIEKVVATSDKQRFALSQDGRRIRANQGHSIEVDLALQVVVPPDVLYHGTAQSSWPAIEREGLTKRSRHAVHLSADVETARKVGGRHGKPFVLTVDAARLHADGAVFHRSENGVWLVDAVPPQYLTPLAT